MLSASVTQGIQRMEGQTEAMIEALANVERAVLDEGWENMYRSCEAKYRAKNALAADVALSEEQRIQIATIAAAAREQILALIAAKEAELKAQTQKNGQHVIDANHVVQEYLLSLQELDAARSKAEKSIADLTGIEVDKLSRTTERALQKLQ